MHAGQPQAAREELCKMDVCVLLQKALCRPAGMHHLPAPGGSGAPPGPSSDWCPKCAPGPSLLSAAPLCASLSSALPSLMM